MGSLQVKIPESIARQRLMVIQNESIHKLLLFIVVPQQSEAGCGKLDPSFLFF